MIAKQRVRSPRYPAVSLPEAERMVNEVFQKDGMNPVDRESAVQHWLFQPEWSLSYRFSVT